MPGFIGIQEIVILVVLFTLIFAAKRPEMGRSLGRGMREFKHGLTSRELKAERELQPIDEA